MAQYYTAVLGIHTVLTPTSIIASVVGCIALGSGRFEAQLAHGAKNASGVILAEGMYQNGIEH